VLLYYLEENFGSHTEIIILTPRMSSQCVTVAGAQWKLGGKNIFRCVPGAVGRIVHIRMHGTLQMKLCEIEVRGVTGKTCHLY